MPDQVAVFAILLAWRTRTDDSLISAASNGNAPNNFAAFDQMADPHDEINRIERDLDQQAGKLKNPQPSGKTTKHQSLDAVVAISGLFVVVALPIVFGGRLNVTQ